MKAQIRLETLSDVHEFVYLTTKHRGEVYITDNNGLKVSAKSVLGALYALEFEELWCECEEDIYHLIEDFIVI